MLLSLLGGSPLCPPPNSCSDITSDAPNLVRCTYSISKDSQSCNNGLQATTILCQKCARHEVQINANPPAQDDPCFTRIPKTGKSRENRYEDEGDASWDDDDMTTVSKGKVSSTGRRKKYILPQFRPGACIPFTGDLSEYKEAYCNCKRRTGARTRTRLFTRPLRPEERPAWNSSPSLPCKPYEETLESAEAKLKALDMAEDPHPDVMALAIIREQVRQRYREKRNCCGGCGGGGKVFGSVFRGSRNPIMKHSYIRRPPKQTAFVKGSHMELLEEESEFSGI